MGKNISKEVKKIICTQMFLEQFNSVQTQKIAQKMHVNVFPSVGDMLFQLVTYGFFNDTYAQQNLFFF